ncbi:MAG TPA: AraC family transcriptional regulator, partial [Candidatus Megamonas gallistercoris]|nr:AraC family transcriptional regulator [Candidatus Megamonas gallistercoris]
IAEYLCFYSASNFIRIFKKYTNMTPLQFRKIFK